MVAANDVRRLLDQRPFRPFRVHLTDGRYFDVRYSKINFAGQTHFDIGIPASDHSDPVYKSFVSVGWEYVERLEPMESHQVGATSTA